MPIYTRTGDTGETGMYGGKRVPKNDAAVGLYGSLDELNSVLGFSVSLMDSGNDGVSFLQGIQSDLFSFGAYLAGGPETPAFPDKRIGEMEREIDRMDRGLPDLRHFVLPGGNTAGAQLHVARTVCRRVERQAVGYGSTGKDVGDLIRYLNRLSDYLFTLARWVNLNADKTEIQWKGKK